ncbi:YeeE/YedE family protein [Pseudochelatococcus sp. B33]
MTEFTPTEFTPLASLAGGALIGLAAVLLLALEGRIAGISGIASRLVPPFDTRFASRLAFIAGLVLAPFLVGAVTGEPVLQTVSSNYPVMIAAGLLVGFGAVYGGGCTSGHGVCGLSRLSPRSIVATGTFMLTAFVTVFVVRHAVGG